MDDIHPQNWAWSWSRDALVNLGFFCHIFRVIEVRYFKFDLAMASKKYHVSMI